MDRRCGRRDLGCFRVLLEVERTTEIVIDLWVLLRVHAIIVDGSEVED
jgi:hypothetical protein